MATSSVTIKIRPPVPEAYRLEGIAPDKRVVPTGTNRFQVAWAKRLHLRIENPGNAPKKVVLMFEGNPRMMDFPFIRNRSTGVWEPIAGVTDGNRVLVAVTADSGVTDFAVSPTYSYEDCEAFVQRLSCDSRVSVSVPGKSAEGRDLWLVKVSEPDCPEELRQLKRRCLLAARAHAWETGANYCFEGIMDYLLSENPRAAMYLQMFDIYLCPMLNPDGVANGVQRHLKDGADLNRDIPTNERRIPGSGSDPELVCHFKVIDDLKPDIYSQFHNMSQKHIDCVLGMDPEHSEMFMDFMPPLARHLKRLGADHGAEGTVPKYCRDKDPSCVACTFEVPWFGRTTADMRETGPLLLEALLNTKLRVDEKKGH